MSFLPTNDCFILVIKTDSYAGNFEREMCGYMTGQVGECGVGDVEIAIFESDNPDNDEFEELIVSFPDDHGCWRPVTIWGNDYNDVAIFFDSRPTDKQLVFLRQRARKFAMMTNPQDGKHKHITIFGFELRDYRVKHTDTGIDTWERDE